MSKARKGKLIKRILCFFELIEPLKRTDFSHKNLRFRENFYVFEMIFCGVFYDFFGEGNLFNFRYFCGELIDSVGIFWLWGVFAAFCVF